MNTTTIMRKAGWLAGKSLLKDQGQGLLNHLCRKCRIAYFKAYSPKDKKDAAKIADQAVNEKSYNKILCPRCKAHLGALGVTK